MSETKLREKNGEHPWGDAGQVVLFVLFVILWVADSFLLRWTTFPAGAVPLALRLVLAAIVWVVALWLVKSGHVVVSGEERPQEIIRSGAFRIVRHPLYLGTLLFYLGLTIATLSLLSLAMFIVIFRFYDVIALYEETLLLAKFGQSYRSYCSVTGRWLPRGLRRAAGSPEGDA
jgi:protein-S-isoprenylcysteine O-methyltransferase Ste14